MSLLNHTGVARLGLLFAVLGGGCNKPSTALNMNLRLSDAIFGATATARIVISRADKTGFPVPASPVKGVPGVTIANYDFDGDGAVDIVLEFAKEYPFGKVNRLALVPSSVTQPIDVQVQAEVYDGLQNLLARLPASIPAVLRPGQVTTIDDIAPACLATCAEPTVIVHPSTALKPLEAAVSAMAAGNLTAAPGRRADLAVGLALAARATGPTAGAVRLYLGGGDVLNADGDNTVSGAQPGDQLGAALAVGDVDGDGRDDLVVGAPGASNSRGTVYVLPGASQWWLTKPFDLAVAASNTVVKRFSGQTVGDRLGASLTLADVDGDGRPEIFAGAPGAGQGAGAVYVVRSADLADGGADGGAAGHGPSLIGRPGSQLGRALAALGSVVAVGAPADRGAGGAVAGGVYLLDATKDFAMTRDAANLSRWLGEGGGFGASLTLFDLEGTGAAFVAAAAPDAGTGTVFIRKADRLDADATGTSSTLRALAPVGMLGAAVARLPRTIGDDLLFGAPFRLEASQPAPDGGTGSDGGADTVGARAGAAFVVRAATLKAQPALRLDAEGRPAAVAMFGAADSDGFGSHLVVGDFNQRGTLDVAVASANARKIYVVLDLFP